MTQNYRTRENGLVSGWMISTIGLIVLSTGLVVLSVWAFMNYTDQKNNTDTIRDTAVAAAVKVQVDADEVKWIQHDKEPMRQFNGPSDYGGVTFDYPKTWSVFVNDDASSGGTYEAYLNPVYVPPVSDKQQFALRVTIETKDYDKVVAEYDTLIKKSSLKSSSVSVDAGSGTRFDGNFSTDIRGSAVVFKIRDKTLTIRTDADTFGPDFEALIKTIKFNQ